MVPAGFRAHETFVAPFHHRRVYMVESRPMDSKSRWKTIVKSRHDRSISWLVVKVQKINMSGRYEVNSDWSHLGFVAALGLRGGPWAMLPTEGITSSSTSTSNLDLPD